MHRHEVKVQLFLQTLEGPLECRMIWSIQFNLAWHINYEILAVALFELIAEDLVLKPSEIGPQKFTAVKCATVRSQPQIAHDIL